MRHVRSLEEVNLSQPSVVTIGVFDGVHRGHQHLIRHLLDHARAAGRVAVVLTFYPYPEMVIRGFQPGYYLTLPDEKARLLGELGVDLVVTHPFNEEVRQIRAADFVRRLLNHLKMQSLWVGPDFALGYKREGDVAFLREQGRLHGFEVRVVDMMEADGERVSSSRVREALRRGDVAEAARLLGRPHRVPGRVVEGARRGHTIGIPTANLSFPREQAIPARGVYAGWALVDGQRVPAVINVGLRPTFDGSQTAIIVEAHLLDFSGDLYGREMALDFVARLRDEQKFNSVEELVAQVQEDIRRGRVLLGLAAPEPDQPSAGE